MNKSRYVWFYLTIIFILAIIIFSGANLLVHAEESSPKEQVQSAWNKALEAGSYRYISDTTQSIIPRPIPEMIGEQETVFDLAMDGVVALPDQSYLTMKVLSDSHSDSVVVLRDGEQAYMLIDGELKPVQNSLNLASQSNDILGYLAAADKVILLDPPEGHPDLTRYGFIIEGPRYAEYVRQKAEENLRGEPGAPQSLTIEPIKALQKLSGQGELWVNSDGFPVRQVLVLELPEVNDQYSAKIRMSSDFSAFGKVESLPRAVQGSDGKWLLQGTLQAGETSNLGEFPGFSQLPALEIASQIENSSLISILWSQFKSLLPINVSPSALIIFMMILLVVIIVRYYHRDPRRCYMLIIFILIPIMVLSPLLETTGILKFFERQALAARESAAALPDLLHALGFDTQSDITGRTDEQLEDNTSPSPTSDYSLIDNTFTSDQTEYDTLQVNEENDPIDRCGDGEPGVDTDNDGLVDTLELCLGTNPNLEDTDQDGISDRDETEGFEYPVGSGKIWTSDPLNPDSNGDGLIDTIEWPTTFNRDGQTVTTLGQAANEDFDNDGIPNIWDNDNDDDGVPDAQDISAFAVTGFTTLATLSTQLNSTNGYEIIEIQVQPQDMDHLRYSTTTLDWPDDDNKGNVQDLDESKEDLRLTPFLIVSTNVAPDQALADKYGFRSWLNTDGKYILMAPLAPVQEMGAVHSYYAKIAYAPGQTTDIQWDAQMVWMAEVQTDYVESLTTKTETRTLNQYQDSFRITGMQVTKDEGYEAAVIATPYQVDDLYLFKLLLGLNNYVNFLNMPGQLPDETALNALAREYTSGTFPGIDVPGDEVVFAGPITYGHMDAALGDLGSEVIPGLLEDEIYSQYYENSRCNDANGNTVNCASLILAYESKAGVSDLSDQPFNTSGVVDPTQMSVNLTEVPLLTTRGRQMNVYEESVSGWQMTTAARMLELMEQRYKDDYNTAMRVLYPNLTADDVRFITYAAYFWATNPGYNPISIDEQILVPEQPSAEDLADDWMTVEEKSAATNAISFWGLGTGIASAIAQAASSLTQVGVKINNINVAYKTALYKSLFEGGEARVSRFSSVGAGLLAISAAASLVMGIINSICTVDSDIAMCRDKTALKAANVVVKGLTIVAQAYKAVELAMKYINEALKSMNLVMKCAIIAGTIVSIAMTWATFGLIFATNGGMGGPAVANALVTAIVMTIYLTILCIIICVPVIGQIIGAIMAVLDAIFYIFTLLFTGTGMTIMEAILKVFYDAEMCVDFAKDEDDNLVLSYGEYDMSLSDQDIGLVDGNTLIVSSPFAGYLVETEFGNADDLAKSSIEGTLSELYDYYKPEELAVIFPSQDKHTDADCETQGSQIYCTNTAAIGYVLTPKINGIVPVQAVIDYTIVWGAFGGGGAWRYSTHVMDGILPEEANIKPTFLYMDVLPNNVTDLWNWSELDNYDPDGDGLNTDLEDQLGTSSSNWDHDGDSLSDSYELEIGTDPLTSDTDHDGLSDDLEIRLRSNPTMADSDGDGLTDGAEVRHFDPVSETLIGGWQVTINDMTFWVSSDPNMVDTDGDDLSDYEEKVNGLSPNAPNQLVPVMNLEVKPLNAEPGEYAGAYWEAGQNVEINIAIANGTPYDVNTDLTLTLPSFLENAQVGTIDGDRTPLFTSNGNQLIWSFSEEAALQSFEFITIPVTATTNTTSGNSIIEASLPFDNITLDKTVNVVQDNDNPNAAILAPMNGAYLRGSNYVVGGTVSDPTTWITKTELSIVIQGTTPNFQDLGSISNMWAYSWNLPGDGIYSIEARATDRMGHINTSAPVSVTVDNTLPTVTLSSSMDGDTVHLSGTASDYPAGIGYVRISIDGQPWMSVPFSDSTWSYDWTVGESAQGEHEVSVLAVDRCGNQNSAGPTIINVDSVAPSSIVTSGADMDVPPEVKTNTNFVISGVADDGGHLPQPSAPATLTTGMNVFDDSTLWLGISTIHENDGGVLAAWIGDFNADRMADLAVGLPGPDGDAGKVSVLYGRAGGWTTPPDLQMLANSPTRFSGVSGARLGSYLAAAGDTNADNFSDLLIGESDSDRAFLIFGNPGNLGEVTLEGGHSGYRTMLQAQTNIESLASAGDVNGDGYSDLLIKAGGTSYLILGQSNPWPETIEIFNANAANFANTTGALGVGDVDGDQLDEWVILKNGSGVLYGWNTYTSSVEVVSTQLTSDTYPRAVALGDVNGDGTADWLFSDGDQRILVYGSGVRHTFSGYDGFFAAPGDINGDDRADILLTTSAGIASLVGEPDGESLSEFATIEGVGGSANAFYTGGADLNSDGSDDLMLIPTQAAAEARGFDAPDFSSGFISPQSLPIGTSTGGETTPEERLLSSDSEDSKALTIGQDTRYVDDDAVNNSCNGFSPCYTTIQTAVNASDGGRDIIIIYPGAYAAFSVPSGGNYDHLIIEGVNADAVFVDGGGTTNAISVSADGVHLSNLTIRNATNGIYLDYGAGEPPVGSGNEIVVDHVVTHSVKTPISMNGLSALTLSDSTLVGNGTDPILSVAAAPANIYYWSSDQSVPAQIGSNGTLINAGTNLYALPGGGNSNIYPATPASSGGVSSWGTPFSLHDKLPTSTGTSPTQQGTNLMAGGATTISQLHSNFSWPDLGGLANNEIDALAIAPNGDIYAGGRFTKIGASEFFYLARWDGAKWNKIGTGLEPNGAVLALVFDDTGNNLYVGGEFTKVGTKDVGHVASWNLSSKTWTVLGTEGWWTYPTPNILMNGVDGPVNALAYDAVYNRVFIGGSFTNATEYGNSSGLNTTESKNLAAWSVNCTPSLSSLCYQDYPRIGVNGTVYSLTLGNGRLYVGGAFTAVALGSYYQLAANHIAFYNLAASSDSGAWTKLGTGLTSSVKDIALLSQSRVAVASGWNIWEWDGSSTWSLAGGYTNGANSVVVDNNGNVFTASDSGTIKVQLGGSGSFETMTDYSYFYTTSGGWAYTGVTLEVDSAGQLYAGVFGWDYYNSKPNGAVSRFSLASFYRRSTSGSSWSRLPYPPTPSTSNAPFAVTSDNGDNLYAIWGYAANGRLYYYNSSNATWVQKANPPSSMTLYHLLWADNSLYALGQSISPFPWHLMRYNPGTNTWTELTKPLIPDGVNTSGLSWVWDGGDQIYLLRGDGTTNFMRYSISSNTWEWLSALSFGITYGPAAVHIGNYLYVYGPMGSTSNFYRYGALPASDLRLAIDRTAFVVPNTASSINWTSLSAATGRQFFLTDIDTSNAWVGPSTISASPALPTGATRLTTTQADFVAPTDGLYRLDTNSSLTAGYHQYKAVAHVYPSQAACTLCTNSLTWGVDAFDTIRMAVESGAARVLVHPGIYPQTFYLVSGVEVIGSGAENTIIEPPPSGTAATLVTAEGVAHSTLARITLSGGTDWTGFLAEGGTKGLKLTRTIIRDLNTGVRVRGNSQLEIVNNTIVRNAYGLAVEGTNPSSVRNTIFAYNTNTGLQNSTGITNTYNDYWSNTNDMDTMIVSLGSLYVDPSFLGLEDSDLRLADNSPLIDKGAPGDPTVPGGGQRVDIGYVEHNAAGFYVSQDYSETSLNDGLTWNVDAFSQIQPALNAAATAMQDLQGVLPEGGFSVAVDTGTYTGNLLVPSHVRLIGSGPAVTKINASTSGSAITFDGVIDSQLSGFTIQNTSNGSAGVELKGAASGITVDRNVIYNNASYGIKLSAQSSAEVLFNTILNNSSAGIYATGTNTWVNVRNNILDGNATGLQAVSSALVRNEYNLLHNTTDLSGVTAGKGTLTSDPAFAASSYYVPSATSPAIDAADPLAAVPPAGGIKADLGYKELIASPLTVLFGPQIKSTVSLGNAGVAKVEVGVVQVTDTSLPVTDTLPTTWQTLTPSQSGQPLFYWSLTTNKSTAGYYRVYSRATDAMDNTENNENDWYEGSFVVDSTAPSLSFTLNPSGTTTATATLATATVSGTVSTGNGTRSDVRQIYFSVSGPAGSANYPADNGQAWIPLPVLGTYTVTAIAVDEAGNQAQQSRTVTVISSSSVATVTNPPNGTAVPKTNILLRGYVRFTGAGNGQVNVSVSGGGSVAAILTSPGAAFSSWSAQVTLPTGDGLKNITVTPSLNGVTGTPANLNLTLDTTPPLLTVTTPATGAYVQQTVTFSGTSSDAGSGLKLVEVSVDGGYTWRQASLNAGSWSLVWDLGLDQDFVSYPAQVRATDAVGNSTTVKKPVAVDNLPPTGIEPVTFNYPVGEHLEDGTELIVNWNTPIDASGSVQVLMDVNLNPPMINDLETVPTTSRSGNSSSHVLSSIGEWYVHIMSQDSAGNQTLTHYGPWYVEDLSDEILNNRHKSVVIDGFIDMGLQEWKTNELLGEDARSGHPQKLYASWDGEYVYLGWSSAWWTLDGVLWAYLDTVENAGTNFRQDGVALPPNLLADQAVEITEPDEGYLWTWINGAWVDQPLDSTDFANGSSGDTEVRIAWYPSPSQKLNLEAYALPRTAENLQPTQPLSVAGLEILAEDEMEISSPAKADITPWALFPTTNALNDPTAESFSWSTTDLTSSNPNQNLPRARTIYMAISSPQAKKTAWGSGSEIDYYITLSNPEPTDFSNLIINLNASVGLAYQSQSGAICSDCTNENAWSLTVPALAAFETKTILVESKITNISGSINKVSSTFDLSSGSTVFTHESTVYETISHRVDGQAPAVTIDALDSSVIPAGIVTFTGKAKDKSEDGHSGSGVASVEVSLNGTDWTLASGTKAWSINLNVSNSPVTLQVRARDYSGILSSVVSHTFYIDSTPPNVTWTLPSLLTNKKASITGTVEDQGPAGSQVRSVEVQIDETGRWYKARLMKSSDNSQKWIWTWLTSKYDGELHKLRVRATDDAGNTTITVSQSTLIDVSGPKITVTQQLSTVMLPNDPEGVAVNRFIYPNGGFNLFLPLVTNGNNASQPSVINSSSSGDSEEETAIQAADDGTVKILAGTIIESSGLAYFIVKITGPGGGSKTEIIPVDDAWDYSPDITGWKVGTYRVRVLAKDNNHNITLLGPFMLEVQDAPIINLKATNDSPHEIDEEVTFTATVASGSNVDYTWHFGDGKSDTGRVVTHAYKTFGTFTATVEAKNSNNTMTASTPVTINASLQPGPDFTVNSNAGTNDHRCDMADCTLREAIDAANNDGKDSTIEMSKLDYGLSEVDNSENESGISTINLLPQITTNITINGHGAHIYRMETIQSGRLFSIPNESVLFTLNEVWLQGGKLDSSNSQAGGAINNFGTLTVKNSLLDSNEASSGAAIYNTGTLNLYTSTLYNNSSENGTIAGSGSFYLYSNTLLNNLSTNISALHLLPVEGSGYEFYNNIIASDSPDGKLCNLEVSNTLSASNLATDSSCTGFDVSTYADLGLIKGTPDDEGGPTPSVAISINSSAVDQGNTKACLLKALDKRDQRNYNRFADGNGDGIATCDIGAFEYGSAAKPPAPAPDETPPQVRILLTPSIPDGANNWYRNPVIVDPQARDTGSEVIDLRCALDPVTIPVTFDDLPEELCPYIGGAPIQTNGDHSFYMAAMDLYSNKSEVITADFQMDTTPPVITCPSAGPFLLHSGDQLIGPANVDASVSGLDEALSTLSGTISTDTVGLKMLNFTAFDLAGNSTSQECSYPVIYNFDGFFPPLEQAPALNPAKAGGALPLKFSLDGDQGLEIIAEGYPASQQVDCQNLALLGDPLAVNPPGSSGLSYDPLTGWYNIIWKTEKQWNNTCRALILQLDDGTQHFAYFDFQ